MNNRRYATALGAAGLGAARRFAGGRFAESVASHLGRYVRGGKANGGRKARRARRKPKKAFRRGRATKSLVKTIKSVVHGEMPLGTYTRHYSGVMKDLVDGEQAIAQDLYRDGIIVAGADTRYFNTARLLDAASVLFNSKAKDLNYSTSLNNFGTEGLKFNIQYMSVTVVVRNITNAVIEFECLVCDNKEDTQSNAAETFSRGLTTIEQAGTPALSTQIGVEPSQIPQMHRSFNTRKIRFRLAPGQEKKIFLKGKTGHCDFDAMYDQTTLQSFNKKFTQQILWRYWPSNCVAQAFAGSGTTAGNYISTSDPIPGIAVEVTEKYKFNAPENTTAAEENDQYAWLDDQGDRAAGSRNVVRSLEYLDQVQ